MGLWFWFVQFKFADFKSIYADSAVFVIGVGQKKIFSFPKKPICWTKKIVSLFYIFLRVISSYHRQQPCWKIWLNLIAKKKNTIKSHRILIKSNGVFVSNLIQFFQLGIVVPTHLSQFERISLYEAWYLVQQVNLWKLFL